MKSPALVWILLGCSFISGCGSGSSPSRATNAPNPSVVDPAKARRQKLVERLQETAELVATGSGNATAQAYALQLRKGTVLRPTVDGVKQEDPSRPKVPPGLLGLVKEDASQYPFWASRLEELRKAAAAIADGNVIIASEESVAAFSSPMLGLIVQHEMMHIEQNQSQTPESEGQHWIDEAQAYLYELRLVREIGGERWDRIVAKEAARLKPFVQIRQDPLSFSIDPKFKPFKSGAYEAEIEGALGCKAASPREVGVRSVLLRVASLSAVLAEKVSEESVIRLLANYLRQRT